MDAADPEPNPSAALPKDVLTELQIKVAQRADKISQKTAQERDRAHWLEAETEILPPE